MYTKNDKGKIRESFPLQITPDVVALAQTLDESISSSTEITLNKQTTIIRVYATGEDIWLKWGTDNVTNANFDEVIPAGQIIDLLVPSGITALNVLERSASAQVVIIEK